MRNLIVLCVLFLTTQIKAQTNYPLDLAKEAIKLPTTSDLNLSKMLNDPRTVFYKLPQAYQFYQPSGKIEHRNLTSGTTYHTTTKEIFGLFYSSYLPEYNANTFFPWETTVGLNHALATGNSPYSSINFINLPSDKPIVILNETPVKWIYPIGATVAEILIVKHPTTNEKLIFEIRTRTKIEESDEVTWEPKVYRPIANRKEFLEFYRLPDLMAKKYLFLRNPQEDRVFQAEGFIERIPDLTEQQVREGLKLSFKDVSSENWFPCSDQQFSIFPKDYTLGLVGSVDSVTCAACHRQTQITVARLIPREPIIYNNPQKVGNIRGSDGIFTWYPFDVSSIASEPTNAPALKTRRYDANNNIAVMYNPTIHKEYRLTNYVQRSLASYELPKTIEVLNKLNTIDTNIAGLSSNDQQIIEHQRICPNCKEKLGSKGVPVKLNIDGTEKFFCCEACKNQ